MKVWEITKNHSQLYQRALDIRENVLGPQHSMLQLPISSIAILYRHSQKYEEALPLFERSLKILQVNLVLLIHIQAS